MKNNNHLIRAVFLIWFALLYVGNNFNFIVHLWATFSKRYCCLLPKQFSITNQTLFIQNVLCWNGFCRTRCWVTGPNKITARQNCVIRYPSAITRFRHRCPLMIFIISGHSRADIDVTRSWFRYPWRSKQCTVCWYRFFENSNAFDTHNKMCIRDRSITELIVTPK